MKDITANPARNKALGFARRGFAVLPLYGIENGKCVCDKPACHSPGKHPLTHLTPHSLKDATTDTEIICEWFDEWPNANYGVLTDRLPTIDVDPRHGGDKSWRKLIRAELRQAGAANTSYAAQPKSRRHVPSLRAASTLRASADISSAQAHCTRAASVTFFIETVGRKRHRSHRCRRG